MVGFTICMVYIVLVLKSIHHFFSMVKEEGQKIAGDIESLRASAKSGGMRFASFILSMASFLKHNKKSKK